MAGAEIDKRLDNNEREIELLIAKARAYPDTITRVIVGNEVLFRNDLTPEQMMAYLDRVRAAVRQPVSIAEPDYIWLKYPELAQHVDFITIHLFPFWNGIARHDAVGAAYGAYQSIKQHYSGQARGGRRDRLALERRPPRVRGPVGVERGDLHPRLDERGQARAHRLLPAWKRSTSRGRRTSAKAAPARTGACSMPTAS